MKNTKIGNNIRVESFESVREFVKVCAARPLSKAFAKKYTPGTEASVAANKRFTGTDSWQEAQNLLATGYKDGCKNLLNCKSGVKVANEISRAKVSRNYAGYAPCVPAAIIGMPKTMYHKTKVISKQPVINLYYDCGVNCNVTTETMTRGGKNLYSLVNYLDKKGIRVNLFLLVCIYKKGRFAYLTIKAKNSDTPVNAQLISYPIIHASFLRRHVFRWIETSECTNFADFTGGYGCNTRSVYTNITAKLQEAKIITTDSYYLNVEDSAKMQSIDDMLLSTGIKL